MDACTRLCVVVPLANEATDAPDGTYQEVGENFKQRMRAALYEAWRRNRRSDVSVVLAFGAGTDSRRAQGLTLAEVCERYALQLHPELPMVVNRYDKHTFGTLAEIRWIVRKVDECMPADARPPRYVFVTQRRHLRRVRFIVRWFFPKIDAEFVVSGQTKEVPCIHELCGYVYLMCVYFGLERVLNWIRRRVKVSFDRG